MALNLYVGEPQHENFPHMDNLFPTRHMAASQHPYHFPEGTPAALPADYQFCGQTQSTRQFIEDTDTSALLVLKDGAVRFEQYYLTGGRDVR